MVTGEFQIRNDHIVFIPAGSVISDGYDRNACFFLYPPGHGFRNNTGAAKCGACLHKKSYISLATLPEHEMFDAVAGSRARCSKINLICKVRLDGRFVDLRICGGHSI